MLAQVNEQRDAIRGAWRRDGGGLLSLDQEGKPGTGAFTPLQLPSLPPLEYQLSLTVRRGTGDRAFVVGLVAGGRQVGLALDWWGARNGSGGGLTLVDDKDWSENQTRFDTICLPADTDVTIDCSVGRDRVIVAVQGKQLIGWQGDPNRLQLPNHFRVPNPDCLFVGTFGSAFALKKIVVQPLAGRSAGAPRASPDFAAAKAALLSGWHVHLAGPGGSAVEIDRLPGLPERGCRLTGVTAPRPQDDVDRILAVFPAGLTLDRVLLSHTAFSDEGAAALGRLKGVRELEVVNTALTDEGLGRLAELPGLPAGTVVGGPDSRGDVPGARR